MTYAGLSLTARAMFGAMVKRSNGREKLNRVMRAVWAAVLVWHLLVPGQAWALPVSVDHRAELAHRATHDVIAPPSIAMATRWVDPHYWGDDDVINILLDRMIRDENWTEWQVYYADTEARIPLMASQQIIGSMSRLLPAEKRLLVRMIRTPEVRNAVVPAEREDELIEKVFALFSAQKQVGPISEAPVDKSVSPFLALDFLFAEDGIFSGRPWDWDNFLPRILTVGGIVIGGLLLVEFLRMVVQIGVRSLSMRTRGKR